MAMSLSDLPPHMQKQALRIIAEEDKMRSQQALNVSDGVLGKEKPSKYRSKKVTATLPDGTTHVFDSMKEFARHEELLLLQQAGEISGLEIQKTFVLLPKQKTPDGRAVREVRYLADFAYTNKQGEYVVEDVKSPATKTQVYKLKKKLMLYVHGIDIKEI